MTSDHPSAPRRGRSASGRSDILLIFDGGSKGNPGLGYGSFVYKGQVVRWQTNVEYPGKTTNNQAEYQTMIAGIRAIIFDCQELDIATHEITLEVRSDSQLVVNQVSGQWKIKNAELRKLQSLARELLGQFGRWDLVWHPRSESVRILGH